MLCYIMKFAISVFTINGIDCIFIDSFYCFNLLLYLISPSSPQPRIIEIHFFKDADVTWL